MESHSLILSLADFKDVHFGPMASVLSNCEM